MLVTVLNSLFTLSHASPHQVCQVDAPSLVHRGTLDYRPKFFAINRNPDKATGRQESRNASSLPCRGPARVTHHPGTSVTLHRMSTCTTAKGRRQVCLRTDALDHPSTRADLSRSALVDACTCSSRGIKKNSMPRAQEILAGITKCAGQARKRSPATRVAFWPLSAHRTPAGEGRWRI